MMYVKIKYPTLSIYYCLMQATYFMSHCALGGFSVVYLYWKGFDNTKIGIILSIASTSSILLQMALGKITTQGGKLSLHPIIFYIMASISSLTFLLILGPTSKWIIASLFITITACHTLLNTLYNALFSLYTANNNDINYGLARGIGSIAFALASFFIGNYIESQGPSTIMLVFFVCFGSVILMTTLATITYYTNSQRDVQSLKSMDRKSLYSIMDFFKKYKELPYFLIGVAFLFYSHTTAYTYLYNVIDNIGGNSKGMGVALAIAAIVEVPTMLLYNILTRKVAHSKWIKIAAFFFCIKIIVMATASNIIGIYLSQSLQLFAFALFTPASVHYINERIELEDNVMGHSLLSMAIGIGGTIANLASGALLDVLNVKWVLVLASIMAGVGFLTLALFLPKEKRLVINNINKLL